MQNRWSDEEAAKCTSLLEECVYASRLLGADTSLVLHGGGNTSVKVVEHDLYGDAVDVLYVKASGFDLALRQHCQLGDLGAGVKHRRAVRAGSDTGAAANALGGVHGVVGFGLADQDGVAVGVDVVAEVVAADVVLDDAAAPGRNVDPAGRGAEAS